MEKKSIALNEFAGSLPPSDGIVNLSPQEAYELCQQGAVMLDVRENYETNYRVFDVPAVIYMPWSTFKTQFHTIPHDEAIIIADAASIYCNEVAKVLASAGYQNIAKLSGGMIDWDASGLPVIKDKDFELGGQCACKIKTRHGDNPLTARTDFFQKQGTVAHVEHTRKRVLFLCVHNSARSQMAEAFLKKHGSSFFDVESAGLEPGKLNPYVIRAMAEIDIDISKNETKSVFDLRNAGKTYDTVITVCSKEAAERCPVFPGQVERYHWPFEDPSTFTGTEESILERVRSVRDAIEQAVINFVQTHTMSTGKHQ